MTANLTSGVFNRGIQAWHGEGDVIDNLTITPAAMFRQASALFPVTKLSLTYRIPSVDAPNEFEPRTSKRSSLVHGITGEELGTCGKGYEVVPNQRLLDMAEAVADKIIMDAVIVLEGGRKVAFTGLIKDGGIADILPSDSVARFLVGYLGHDGCTGVSAGFGSIRVVCSNTLAAHVGSSAIQRTLAHRKGVGLEVDALINSINVEQRRFDEDIESFKEMARIDCSDAQFREMLKELYAKELAVPIKGRDGSEDRPRDLGDIRVCCRMADAWLGVGEAGLGLDIPGVRGTAWAAYNAITEALTSQQAGEARNNIRRFSSTFFGSVRARIDQARKLCLSL